ncbi:MAG: hypothetical protein KC505_10890 [Myxococcales bacterium]|nr:hypothetical protein [Myxococcales bacterium]USN51752.1 MAG: hypothetical protein H6731_04920 [Myxococcales bacterium]
MKKIALLSVACFLFTSLGLLANGFQEILDATSKIQEKIKTNKESFCAEFGEFKKVRNLILLDEDTDRWTCKSITSPSYLDYLSKIDQFCADNEQSDLSMIKDHVDNLLVELFLE